MSRPRRSRVKYDQFFLGVAPKEQFQIEEKLTSSAFNVPLTRTMQGTEFTLKYLQEHGFTYPVRFPKTCGLGIAVPNPSSFTIKQVKQLVGPSKMIHVQCCKTQTTIEMSMAKFVKYYLSKGKEEIYNVLSLEFSDTKMDRLVKRPSVVDEIDWVDLAFPAQLKEWKSDKLYYPKVQKYCLMSVAGSYTTFHVDFGGTSVWYHVLKGKKIFWVIEPTEENLEIFERWISTRDDSVFLGDLVSECQRVELEAGMTFMMPGGWIHAVYTPVDSLVFGGNFLHSFNARMQERIVVLESNQRIPPKQRFPLLKELQWYLLDYYVQRLGGKSYLTRSCKKSDRKKQSPRHHAGDLSRFEFDCLSVLVDKLGKTKTADRVFGLKTLPRLHAAALRALTKHRKLKVAVLAPENPVDTTPAVDVRPPVKSSTESVTLGSESCHAISQNISKKRDRLEAVVSLLKQNKDDSDANVAASSSALKRSRSDARLEVTGSTVAKTAKFDSTPSFLGESRWVDTIRDGNRASDTSADRAIYDGDDERSGAESSDDEHMTSTCLRISEISTRPSAPCEADVQNLSGIDDLFEKEISDEEYKNEICLRCYAKPNEAPTKLNASDRTSSWIDELIEHVPLKNRENTVTISMRYYAK